MVDIAERGPRVTRAHATRPRSGGLRAGRRWLVFLVVIVGLVWAVPAAAQTGGLEICVFAESAQPIPGATVTLSSSKHLSPTVASRSGTGGCTSFPVLRAGSGYAIEVSMPGFATYRLPDLRVPIGQTVTHAVVMSAEITERIQVLGRAAIVDLDKTGTTTRFDATFIENLPIPGRFYQNILTLAPGVLDEDGDGNPNVHGSRERNFRAIVDGVANTDPLTGEWLSLLNSDSIEEMEILGTGAGVEYGRASGGFARLIQKQGSNEFEGLFSMIYRSSIFDGGATGDLLATPESSEFAWYQPALQVSGPILKDRLWFRLSHEWISREDPIVTLSGLTTTTRRQAISSDQITWQMSPRNKLSFSFQTDPTTIENFGVSSRVPANSSQRVERGGPTFKINWTAPVSPRLLVDTTIAYQDLDRGFFPTAPGEANNCLVFGAGDGGFFNQLNTARCFDTRTGLVSGSHNETWEDRRQRLTVSTQATWYSNRLFGFSHRFKFGMSSENERFFRSLHRGPSINFEVEDVPFGDPVGRAFVRVAGPPTSENTATGNSWAVYIEDQFKPISQLSLTVGLRYDREEIFSRGLEALDPAVEADTVEETLVQSPSTHIAFLFSRTFTAFSNVGQFRNDVAAAVGATAAQIPLGAIAIQSTGWVNKREVDSIAIINNNLSPRVSFAWDPWADGKTKIALTGGRYYDKIFLAVPLIDLEPPTTELEFIGLFRGNQLGGFINGGLNGGFSPSIATQTVNRGLRTPYQDEFTISFEREIAAETAIRATWIRRKFRDQLQDIDLNHVPGDKGRCLKDVPIRFPAVITSLGTGEFIDPYTGEVVQDTDPGPGDGVIDDCSGEVAVLGGLFGTDISVPDGIPDLYLRNPGWNEILEVGNYNETDYRAFVLELTRRLYRNWQMSASYTWSEAIGDAEDFNQLLGNERNLFDQERGFLSFDQTHVVKINAMTILRKGLQVGGVLRWESGLPFSVIQSRPTLWSIPPLYLGFGDVARSFRFRYPSGARNDERNPAYWTLDLRVAKEFRVGRRVDLQATVEVFNVLNDQTLIISDRIDQTLGGVRRFGRQFQLGLRVGF